MSEPEFDLAAIMATLRGVLPSRRPLPLHEPWFAGRENEYVKDCIDTAWVSSVGAYVDRFEAMLAEYTGAGAAVACVTGTAALQVALRLSGVERGDEVLVPALTFIATANAVSHLGALPHFIDSGEASLGIDPERLGAYLDDIARMSWGACINRHTGGRISAIVPMHVFGHPVDMEPLLAVAKRFGLAVIEDAAESLGSTYHGRHCGTLAPLACLSFNGNKTVTTGGGGAILARDPAMAKRAKHLTSTAKLPHKWAFEHDEIGYNYRMPNLNAALGCAQLERLGTIIAGKRALAQRYRDAFAGTKGVRVVAEPAGCASNYWLNALLLDERHADGRHADGRDRLLQASHDDGILTRPAWTLMHRLGVYASCPRMDLSVAESLERRLINLPSSPVLAAELGLDVSR